ncbi:UNVERIFIED_CONTAM: exopolysaccharide biosynthesis polyprenyl glycosylphosphotransferase [Williamsia faeni]
MLDEAHAAPIPAARASLELVDGNFEHWSASYVRRVHVTDWTVVLGAVVGAVAIRFTANGQLHIYQRNHLLIETIALSIVWILALHATQSADKRIVGSGATEYSRVASACFMAFGFLAIFDLVFKLDIARGFVAVALPFGTVGLLASRWAWRKRLTRQRANGTNLQRILIVGDSESSIPLIDRIEDNRFLGYKVVGLVNTSRSVSHAPHRPGSATAHWGHCNPPTADIDALIDTVKQTGATTVAVTSASALGYSVMRELSWELESMDVDMVVAPGVTDIAGPRMMLRPVAGLPMVHIDKPRYAGANRFLKAGIDRLSAFTLLILLTPVLGICAIAIKCTSAGPIFYRAERIGLNNSPFLMWKFRSMVDGADRQKATLIDRSDGNGVLFKMRDDPRVTRVGAFLRRCSLDELPQLVNVLTGDMSLVGPRPPLREEVAQYQGPVVRRLLVRPGMTGLWQVSGRSELSWDESVRLDLLYVENWSIMQDLVILWRTLRAVIRGRGAY